MLCYNSNLFLAVSYMKELNLDMKCFSHEKERKTEYIYIYIYIYKLKNCGCENII